MITSSKIQWLFFEISIQNQRPIFETQKYFDLKLFSLTVLTFIIKLLSK